MKADPLTVVVGVATVLLAIVELVTRGRGVIGWLWRRLAPRRGVVPRDTVRVVPQHRGQWWAMGSRMGRPVMQVVGRWHVTNVTDAHQVRILRARVLRPATDGRVLIQHPHADMFGDFPVLPGATREVDVDWWIQPPVCEEGKDFKARVALVDQFGNEHKLGTVVFRGPERTESQTAETTEPEEKGFLDYIVEGNEAAQRLTDSFKRIAQATKDIGDRIGSRARQIQHVGQKPGPATAPDVRKLTAATAREITQYAASIEGGLSVLENSVGTMGESISGYLEWADPKTDQEKEALRSFRATVVLLRDGADFATRSTQAFRDTAAAQKGVSREFNQAIRRQTRALDAIISILETAQAMCERAVYLIDQKLSNAGAQPASGDPQPG